MRRDRLDALAASALMTCCALWGLNRVAIKVTIAGISPVWAAGLRVVVVAFATYLAWFWLLAHYPASNLAAFSFWTPLFGVAAGALLMGDRVSPALGAAVLLVAAGIVLVNRRPPGSHRRV
jgi:drug/metabolite transporter (DMT)-like permease